MKKIKLLQMLGILLITFGITFLNFEDFSFKANIRAYASIILGIIMTLVEFYQAYKLKK
jgi:hypothetical protein